MYLVTGPFGVFFVFFVIADPHTRSSRVVTWRCAVHFSFYKVLPVKVAVIRIVNRFYKMLLVKVAVISR